MKKLSILILALILTIALSTVAMAGTLGVNVNPGYSLSFEKETDYKPVAITFGMGLRDNLLMNLNYYTEVEGYGLDMRYEIIEGLAATIGFTTYQDSDIDQLTLDLRSKYNFTENLALAGKIEYIKSDNGTSDADGFAALCQAEYTFNKTFAAVLGAEYDDISDTTFIVASLEVYPMEGVTFWGDYRVDTDDSKNDSFIVGIELTW